MPLIEVLDEAYVGKTKELKKMEFLIDKIRKKYIPILGGSGFYGVASMLNTQIESSAEWQELRKCFEDTFGFYSVSLILDSTSELPNAYTVPVNLDLLANVRSPFALEVNGKGIKYDKKQRCCTIIVVYASLLFSQKLSSAEVFAVLLHEVGHNFNTAVLPAFLPVPIFVLINHILANSKNTNPLDALVLFLWILTPGRVAYNYIQRFIQENPSLLLAKKLFVGASSILSYINSFISKIMMPVAKLSNLNVVASFLRAPGILAMKLITANVFTYHQETFSDSFATLMGYGPELQSALVKMDDVIDEGINTDAAFKHFPLIGHWMGLNEYVMDHFASLIDGHPNINARIKTSISILEKDLEDPRIDKKTKYIIKDDLKKLNKIYDKFNRLDDSDEVDYPQDTRAALEAMSEFIYGRHMPDFRSGLMDLFYGGASSIHNYIEWIKRKS